MSEIHIRKLFTLVLGSILIVIIIAFIVVSTLVLLQPLEPTRPTQASTQLLNPAPTQTPTSAPTQLPTQALTQTPTQTLLNTPTSTIVFSSPLPFYETTDNSDVSSEILGEINVEYPIRMSPEMSDMVIASIFIPEALANLKSSDIIRIVIPADEPPIIGELNLHKTTILIAEAMRVELSSPTFEFEALKPSRQNVSIQEINQETFWAWTIQAPSILGTQIFTMKVYLKEDINPVWIGSFYVQVIRPSDTPQPTETSTYTPTNTSTYTITPTSTPTLTPAPPLSKVTNRLIEKSATVFGAILTFIAAMTGIYVQNNRTKDRIEELQENIREISDKRDERYRFLNSEISRLRSIKWWQFWRR
ncbi:hypothetical protein GF380_00875 [Candidatus Uhrbacteria bacterium]|nr:hypothetical protein [Candidatus Uhrbacteria bacterium]